MKAEEKLEERRLAGGVEGGGEEGRGVNFLKVYNILKEHPHDTGGLAGSASRWMLRSGLT